MSDDRTDDSLVEEVIEKPKSTRKLTDADVKKYDAIMEWWLNEKIAKNWKAETFESASDAALGNTGWTIRDFRQWLRTEVCVALHKYNPEYKTKKGQSVKEFTFVYRHLEFRVGQLMKKLTKKGMGYGVWHANIEEILWEIDKE